VLRRLDGLALSGRRVVEGTASGAHRSPIKGASVEFRQHRAYVPGDEPRKLDWRVLARTDRPYVREYEQETKLRGMLVLDASGSMGYGGGTQEAIGKRQEGESKFEFAAKVAAALSYLMLSSGESVGISLAGEMIHSAPPATGTAQLARVIDLLERSGPAQGPADLQRTLAEVAQRLGRRSLVMLISDFFAPVEALKRGFARLVHGKHEAIALRILHRHEIEFPFRTWRQFRGLEGERARLVEPAMMRRAYLEAFQTHQAQLQRVCGSLGVELHTMISDEPMVDALLHLLRRRTEKQMQNLRFQT